MAPRNGTVATVVGFLLALAGAGCGAGRATHIGTSDVGGAVMLNGNNDQAWAQAQRLMAARCEGAFLVVKRGQPSAGVPDGRGAVPASAVVPGPMDMGLGPAYGERIDYECTGPGGPLPLTGLVLPLPLVPAPRPVPLASSVPF
jgi:hypothetical protein